MSDILKLCLFLLGFAGTFATVHSQIDDDLLVQQLGNLFTNGIIDGYDPLKIAYIPIPINYNQGLRSSKGFMIIQNLELDGLSKVKWNLVYNATKMVAIMDFNIPIMELNVESCMMDLKITEQKIWGKPEVTKWVGEGELKGLIESFKVSIEVKLEERRNRLRISDLTFKINLDWCDLHWDTLMFNGNIISDWDEICENIILGVDTLNEDNVSPYVEEIFMSTFNVVLLAKGSSASNVAQSVSQLGGKLVH